MGQIAPIFKKDDELVKKNYRPVTVLPCLNNIFEKLLSSQLEGFYNGLPSDLLSATLLKAIYFRNHLINSSIAMVGSSSRMVQPCGR